MNEWVDGWMVDGKMGGWMGGWVGGWITKINSDFRQALDFV